MENDFRIYLSLIQIHRKPENLQSIMTKLEFQSYYPNNDNFCIFSSSFSDKLYIILLAKRAKSPIIVFKYDQLIKTQNNYNKNIESFRNILIQFHSPFLETYSTEMNKQLSSFFYSLEILYSTNSHPKLFWALYIISTVQTFLALSINQTSIIFPQSRTIATLHSLVPESSLFAYLIAMFGFQLLSYISIACLAKRNNILKSNLAQIFLKILFFLSLINHTVNLPLACGFDSTQFRIPSMVICIIFFILNSSLFNFTLASNRIWGLNQMFVLDLMRLACVLAYEKKMIVIVMVIYLLASILVTFFRPVYLLSAQNKYAQLITSLSVQLAVFILVRMITETYAQSNVAVEIIASLMSVYLIRQTISMYLQYRIKQLYQKKDQQSYQKQSSKTKLYSIEHFLLLYFLQQNYEECQNQIKLYMIAHYKNCENLGDCKCKIIFEKLLAKTQPDEQNSIKQHLGQENNKIVQPKSIPLGTIQSKEEDIQIKVLFSEFTLYLLTEFLETQLNFSQDVKNQVNSTTAKDSKKEVLSAENRQTVKSCLILQYIKLQKLSSTAICLNKAYLELKAIEFQLKQHKIFSMVEAGILTSLKYSIVKKKEIAMMTDTAKTNKFCIKFFNCQKVANKLQQLIIKAVNEVKLFWTEVKMQQPDDEKILGILENFSKFHAKIMEIYNRILRGQEKESAEVRIMFMFYGKVLELEGHHKFFSGHLIKEEKGIDLKHAASNNLHMYSDDANTHVMSFSIGKQTFGHLKYTSFGGSSMIDPSFNKISHFLPKECEPFHNNEITAFLTADYNYYKHSDQKECFLKVSPNLINPVFLETHLMAFLSIGEIELIAFFKPLIQEHKMLIHGEAQKQSSDSDEVMVVCCDRQGKLLSWTKGFELAKESMFEEHDIEDVLTQELIERLNQNQPIKVELDDSDYLLFLIKKVQFEKNSQDPRQSSIIFIEFIQKFQQRTHSTVQPIKTRKLCSIYSSRDSFLNIRKKKNIFNMNQLLQKAVRCELDEVQKLDEIKQKTNKIWQIAVRPEKNSFMLRAFGFVSFCSVLFCTFMIVTTVLVKQKKSQLMYYNEFYDDIIKMQISMGESVTYLRQINIKLFNGIQQNIERIPSILNQVDKLSSIIHTSMLKLGNSFIQEWMYFDVSDSQQSSFKPGKAYSLISNYYLNSVTNVVENTKKEINQLNITIIESEHQFPYTDTVINFLRLIHNGIIVIIPELMKMRENTLNKNFLPEIQNITVKPFFYIPATGFIACIVLLWYFIRKNMQLTNLASESISMFHKLKVSFADRKIKQIIKNQSSMNTHTNHTILSQTVATSKKLAWNQLSQIFQQQSSRAFGSFLFNALGSDHASKLAALKPKTGGQPRESIAFNLPSPAQEDTDRQLNKKDTVALPRISDMSIYSDGLKEGIQSLLEIKDVSKKPEQNLQFGKKPMISVTFSDKARFWFIAVPLLVYFFHIFMISLDFNKSMQNILVMKNQLLNRESLIVLLSSYKYELGLYIYPRHFGTHITRQIEKGYLQQKQIISSQSEVDANLFGYTRNYKKALDMFMYNNICDNLDVLGKPHKSFNVDYNKEECEYILDGTLTHGFKQSYLSYLMNMNTLTSDYYRPQLLTRQTRFDYLNDARVSANAKLYPYIFIVAKYINDAFDKDIQQCLDNYELFVVLDAPIMMALCFTSILYFLIFRYFQANRELTIIKSCFLLVGNKSLIQDPSIIRQIDGNDPGDRFYFLE